MKALFTATALVLAASAMPMTAIAQDITQTETIVVLAKFQKDWNKGSALEAQGLKELEKAKTKLIESSADVVSSQNKRDSSLARSENAAGEFRNLTSTMPYFSDATEAARWARQVEASAKEWAKYDGRQDDGSDDLEKARKAQIKAQAAVDKAQLKIEKGRTMKFEAERLSSVASRN